MQNVYKCIYDYDGKQVERFGSGGSNILGLFNVIVEADRFVLVPINRPNLKNKDIYLNNIKKIDMSLSTGLSTMITINRATVYQIDLNIYLKDKTLLTLEFRSYRAVVALIKKVDEQHIYINDPMNLLEIISMGDRWAIEKYFTNNIEEIKKQYQIEEMRKKDRYVNK